MSRPRLRLAVFLLLLLAVVTRAAMVAFVPMPSMEAMYKNSGDEQYYYRYANSIVEHGYYQEQNNRATFPPAYPAFLAANIKLFGDNRTEVQIVQNVMFVGCAALLSLAVGTALGVNVGLMTMLLLLLHPVWLRTAQEAYSENLFAVWLALEIFLALKLWRSGKPGLAVLLGVVMGLSGLTREVGLGFGLVLCYITYRTLAQRDRRLGARSAGLMLATMVLMIIPWTVRNYIVFGRFVLVSTNPTLNLYMGNNPKANGNYVWIMPERVQKIWNTPSPRGANEIEGSRLAGREAVRFMVGHPWRTAQLWAIRFYLLWRPTSAGPFGTSSDALYKWYRLVFYIPYLVIAVVGLWRLRRVPLGRLLIGILVVGTLMNMATLAITRYRSPYEFLMAVPAAYVLASIFRRNARASARPDESPAPAVPVGGSTPA